MEHGDEVLAVAAAHRLGLVASRRWPMVAAHLLVAGHDGEHVTQLAGLSAVASGWEVDQLTAGVMDEISAPMLTEEAAADVVARLFMLTLQGGNHPVIRALAALAPTLDYPGGFIHDAYLADEWLDCDCHGPADADRVEAAIAALPPLRVSTPFAEALTRP